LYAQGLDTEFYERLALLGWTDVTFTQANLHHSHTPAAKAYMSVYKEVLPITWVIAVGLAAIWAAQAEIVGRRR
jgi:hypothetical protein